MIRATRGFDECDYNGAALSFAGFTRTFNQGSMVTGRDGIGQALFVENTAFGTVNYIDIFDSQSTWGFNMDFQWSGGSQPNMVWYTIGYLGTVLFSLKLRADGTMDLLDSLGSVLVNTGSTSTGFSPGQYCTLELKVSFGVSGTASLWKNGVLAANKNAINFGSTLPDRMGFQMTGFGPPGLIIDNYLIYDGQPGFNGQYGRQRILSILPTADLQGGEWLPTPPGPSFATVNDHNGSTGGSPNGDVNYIKGQATGPDAVFTMAASPCSGLILGLSWNACARPDPTVGTPGLDFVYIPTLVTIVVGHKPVTAVGQLNPDAPVATDNYFTYQVPKETNPNTSSGWLDQEIPDGAFGVGASASPDQRVTAFYLEKVIDLTGKPFDCGGGGVYSF